MSHFDNNGKGDRRRGGSGEERRRYEAEYDRIFAKKTDKKKESVKRS